MRAFLTRLYERWKATAYRSAVGTPVPAGLDPDEPGGPTARERMLMRRRLRALGREDAEAEVLRRALAERQTLEELLATGAVVRCPSCGELAGRSEPLCANCGARLASEQATERRTATAQNGHATAPTTTVTGASSVRSPTPPAR